MFDGIIAARSINFLLVFFEGVLSFFSPCVIPLLPVYISYLAGNARRLNDDGTFTYDRKKMFLHTLFFVLGVSCVFFILGMSFSVLGTFFSKNKLLFTRIGGIIIILLGLVQIGFIEVNFLKKERRFNPALNLKQMNPLAAFIMGFFFSFAWTPCVGPALSSVLILASSAKTAAGGNLLVLLYAIGFIIPFLALGLFTTRVLDFLKAKRSFLKYTVKIGGVILVIMGVMTFTGWFNTISGYLNSYSNPNQTGSKDSTVKSNEEVIPPEPENMDEQSEESQQEKDIIPAFDFTLTDQYGNAHTLSDYKGKVVFLNFWATWCPPCRSEMPHIEELYNELGKNGGDVVILGTANPGGQEKNISGIKDFLTANGYTFPVVFDETGEVFLKYSVNVLPTTFMIDKDGNIFGYVSGALSKDMMKNIIEQTLEGKQK